MNVRQALMPVLFVVATNCFAEPYVFIGGNLGRVSHDLSGLNYPIIDFRAGAGYSFSQDFSAEIDVGGETTGARIGEGTCTTTLGTTVPCTKKNEVKRQLLSLTGVYEASINSFKAFGRLGAAIIDSSYNSTIDAGTAGKLVLADASAFNVAGIANAGVIFSNTHRVSVALTSKYGTEKTGKFSYVGLEYNYVFRF